MKLTSLLILSTLAATPTFAQETRQMDSHEHGVGQLDIAIDGAQIAMVFHAPGADIVGFEYAAKSDDDMAKVDAALMALAQPLDIFAFPDAAQCTVIEADAELEGKGAHGDHDDDHKDHNDEDGEHAEENHDHEDHADEDAGHTEFHAEYLLDCGDISALTDISFNYFAAFPNALELEVQIISDAGATAFEVERDAPMLDLSDL